MTVLRLRRLLDLGLLALAACMFSAMPAQAANITIDDTAADDTITISWDHFESFFINFGTDLGPDGTVSGLSEQFPIGITGNWFATTFGQGTTDVYFLEPGTGAASDMFHGTYGGGGGPNPATINAGFQSDSGGNSLIVPPGAVTIFEDDPNHEIGRLLPNLPSDLTIHVTSDVEASQVPEPTSLLLLGTGLGFVARRWRTRQANA